MTNQSQKIEEMDVSSRKEFYDYYAEESLSEGTLNRLQNIKNTVTRTLGDKARETLDVVDIGCGAGTLSRLWAEDGHRVFGLDINQPLIELAQQRADEEGSDIQYSVGTANDLPWESASKDVCLVPELLEHVTDWQTCLDEFARILKPGGVLYLSTNNTLCPIQQEFTLPLYSWYPGFAKRYFEKLAMTTHPQIAGHATYPAVNWFTFYSLRKEFARRGMDSMDRFDMMDVDNGNSLKKIIIQTVRAAPPLRFMAHVFTPYTAIMGIKKAT